MRIEAHGQKYLLEELCLILGDRLQESGFESGPRLGMMDAGNVMSYVKDGTIVSVQLTEESEQGTSTLSFESEVEIPVLLDIWDSTLIDLGKKIKNQLLDYAMNKQKVEQGIG